MDRQERYRILDLGTDFYFKFIKKSIDSPREWGFVEEIGLYLDKTYNKGYKAGQKKPGKPQK